MHRPPLSGVQSRRPVVPWSRSPAAPPPTDNRSQLITDDPRPLLPVKRRRGAQQRPAMRTPEHRQRRDPTALPIFDLLQLFLAGGAERPFVVPGFNEVDLVCHNLLQNSPRFVTNFLFPNGVLLPERKHHECCQTGNRMDRENAGARGRGSDFSPAHRSTSTAVKVPGPANRSSTPGATSSAVFAVKNCLMRSFSPSWKARGSMNSWPLNASDTARGWTDSEAPGSHFPTS